MSESLPETDVEFVNQQQAEYDNIFQTGSNEEVEAARFRCSQALSV